MLPRLRVPICCTTSLTLSPLGLFWHPLLPSHNLATAFPSSHPTPHPTPTPSPHPYRYTLPTLFQVIAESNPYDHFRSDGCTIFPDQPVPGRPEQIVVTAAQRREDRLARQQLRLAMREVEAEVGRVDRRCPFCSHRNFRGLDNSNHHRCEHCGGAFCFLCGADLRRGVRGHFRPGSHPQHAVLRQA